MFIVFSIWVPDTFLQWNTWKALFDSQAVTAILAIGLVIALSAGAFDLAIGAELGFGAIFVAWLLVDKGVGAGAGDHPHPAGGRAGRAGQRPARRQGADRLLHRHPGDELGPPRGDRLGVELAADRRRRLVLRKARHHRNLRPHPAGLPDARGRAGRLVPARAHPAGRRVYATGGNIEAARLAGRAGGGGRHLLRWSPAA